MTFPIMTKGGGICAFEASAGGRVSRVGARFTQERTAQLPEGAERSVTSILPLAAHICVQAAPSICEAPTRNPGGKCGDLVPLAYLAAGTSACRRAAPVP